MGGKTKKSFLRLGMTPANGNDFKQSLALSGLPVESVLIAYELNCPGVNDQYFTHVIAA
jgi:hypothetical protein